MQEKGVFEASINQSMLSYGPGHDDSGWGGEGTLEEERGEVGSTFLGQSELHIAVEWKQSGDII